MTVTNILLLVILILIFILPLVVKKVEENLEVFLFIMGVLATAAAGSAGELEGGYGALVNEIFSNVYMYIIVAIVLVGGFLFKALSKNMHSGVRKTLEKIPIEGFVFLFTVLLGLLSSVITAIVASLVLVEIVNVLPLDRSAKVKVNHHGVLRHWTRRSSYAGRRAACHNRNWQTCKEPDASRRFLLYDSHARHLHYSWHFCVWLNGSLVCQKGQKGWH